MLGTTHEFRVQQRAAHSSPYLVLGIDWSGTFATYYLDRDTNSFTAAGPRCPPGTFNAVQSWGSIGIELREGQINSADQVSVTLWDGNKNILSLLNAAPQQRRQIRIWQMFDDLSTVWPFHRLLIFVGAMEPFSWVENEQTVTINAVDASSLITQDIGKRAFQSVWTQVHRDYIDAPLPLVWGRGRRVPAIPVHWPWQTTAFTAVPTGSPPVTFEVLDHPSDLGATNQATYQAWLGVDEVEGHFTQSADPDNVPSTFTITSQAWTYLAKAPFYLQGGTLHVQKSKIEPGFFDWAQISLGFPVQVTQLRNSVVTLGTITLITASTFGRDWFAMRVSQSLSPGQSGFVSFIDPFNVRRPWPEGTQLTEREVDHVYLFNMLPSESVESVEGWGALVDEGGGAGMDFITMLPESYVVAVNNTTWASDLGHGVATVQFRFPPRVIAPELESNEIWVTCRGTRLSETKSNQWSANPVEIIHEILENPHLMNIPASDVDQQSFADAVTLHAATRFGFAQLEIRDGLELLQELATQAQGVLQFDAGQARMVILSNSNGPIQQTFNSLNIVARSLQTEETTVKDLVSHLIVPWRRDWDNKTGETLLKIVKYNTAVLGTWGRNHREMQATAFDQRGHVDAFALFWLDRFTRIYEVVKLQTFYEGLRLQPGDWIMVQYTDGEGNVHYPGTFMEVQARSYTPQSGTSPPIVEITARWPKFIY